jgi:hypothetical protein
MSDELLKLADHDLQDHDRDKGQQIDPRPLKQASRHLSDAVEKMGFDHALACHLDTIRKFRIAKNDQDVRKRIKQVLEDTKFP